MDLPIPSEGAPVAPILVAESERIMGKIIRKTSQLKTTGMIPDDRENLKERLRFAWSEAHDDKEATSVTAWRKKKARKSYTDIQDANNHLFLAVILAITPTECSTPAFKTIKDSLISLKSYEDYRLNVDFTEKHFFESTAAEQSFISNHRYLNFMNSIFPQEDKPCILRNTAR
ncbi:hypothetical protein B0J14DRAFT_658850 [Halenospora varia]|nr:hypothetical protein B0J14DRAFT_658850 [Halenospora varia]